MSTASKDQRKKRARPQSKKSEPNRMEGSCKPGGKVCAPTRIDTIIALLSRNQGASLAELAEATGWQTHSIRGALAGALKRKGFKVQSDKTDGVRRYRVEAGK